MLPPTLPLFPLPNVVLFPNVFLPLHIFEQRYRAMVADAVAGDRLIGMVLLRPGWEGRYEERPEVYSIGTAGLITFSEQYGDGRYNIVLRGLEKFRILGEDAAKPYRVAHVQPLPEEPDATARALIRARRERLEALLVPGARAADPKVPPSMSDDDLVNALAQYMDFEPVEKQALLERDGLVARCESLMDLLEMKLIASQGKWDRNH
jgi:Lon protease-like protein